MKRYHLISASAVFFALVPTLAYASAGAGLQTDVSAMLEGHIGTALGLGVSLFGMWLWLAQQSAWGLGVVISGAAVTAFPSLYAGLADGFRAAFSNAVGGSGSTRSATARTAAAPARATTVAPTSTGRQMGSSQPTAATNAGRTVVSTSDGLPWSTPAPSMATPLPSATTDRRPVPADSGLPWQTASDSKGPRKGGLWDPATGGAFTTTAQQERARQNQPAPSLVPVQRGGVTSVGGFYVETSGKRIIEHKWGGVE